MYSITCRFQKRVEDLDGASGITFALGHTYGVDDDVLLPVPVGSGCSRSSSESHHHDGVMTVVVEISGRASL
jgi:hypothetical protein